MSFCIRIWHFHMAMYPVVALFISFERIVLSGRQQQEQGLRLTPQQMQQRQQQLLMRQQMQQQQGRVGACRLPRQCMFLRFSPQRCPLNKGFALEFHTLASIGN